MYFVFVLLPGVKFVLCLLDLYVCDLKWVVPIFTCVFSTLNWLTLTFDLKTYEGDISGSGNHIFFRIPHEDKWLAAILFSGNLSNFICLPLYLYNTNTNLWPYELLDVRITCRVWTYVTFLEFLSRGGWLDILWSNIQALLIFDPIYYRRELTLTDGTGMSGDL